MSTIKANELTSLNSGNSITIDDIIKTAEDLVTADVKLSQLEIEVNNTSGAREWIAPTVTQPQVESGAGDDRVAFTVTRIWQAMQAFWAGKITQVLGESDDSVVSQKALTDSLNSLANTGTLSDVYSGAYGLTWDSLTDTYIRTGASGYASIQSKLRRCVLNEDGTVNYFLDPTNSNSKADGTPSNLAGADGNVMVQIPKFYAKYEMVGTLRKASISLTPELGYTLHPAFIKGGVEVDYRYYRAYKGIVVGGKLRSVSGVTTTQSITIANARIAAKANGAGWHLTDHNLLFAVQTLALIELGTLKFQDVLGAGLISGNNYGKTTGSSNALGNRSTSKPNTAFMSYRGIEDLYGTAWEFLDGVNVNEREVFVNSNHTTFASDVFTGDYVSTGVTVPADATSSYIKDLDFSIKGFIPTVVGGASTTYTGDGLWSATGNRIASVGGSANVGEACGGFTLSANNDSAWEAVSFGAGVSF